MARRFCLVAYAGKVACDAGVLPEDMDVWNATVSCFNDWLAVRGGAGAGEDAAIVEQVRRILERDGGSRFQPITDKTGRWIDRLGFSETRDNEEMAFYVLPEQFKAEVIKGYSVRTAVVALQKAGVLLRGPDRVTVKKRVPGLGATWCYELVIPSEGGESIKA